jgi:ketol-acid reductoisomerase
LSVADAARRADVVSILVPDPTQPSVFEHEIAPHLVAGNAIVFAHGFNVHFGQIEPPAGIDVYLVAPKAPGHRVREVFDQGGGVPALIAVAQDATGEASARALAYAHGLGSTRAGVLETTFAEETETDLFGEQAVLCGGVTALVRSGFEVLVEAGYQPEIAYFECLHELKLIVDLMYRGGLSTMWHSVSDTAEHGGYEGGDRLVTPAVKQEMQAMLEDIRNGEYAKRWMAEHADGSRNLLSRRADEQNHAVEKVGRELRAMMNFLDAKDTRVQANTAPAPETAV